MLSEKPGLLGGEVHHDGGVIGGAPPSSFTYGAECKTVDDVDALSRVVGVRSIAPMPLIRTIRPRGCWRRSRYRRCRPRRM